MYTGEKRFYTAAPWSCTEDGFSRKIGMSFEEIGSCPDVLANRKALMRFCTATLWGCVYTRAFKKHLKTEEQEIWRSQSLISSKQPTDVYMGTRAWLSNEGEFHWKVERAGKCFHPILPGGYRKLWNQLVLGADSLLYDEMVASNNPDGICRVWQGLSVVYDRMLPRVLEGADAPEEYMRMGGRKLPGWLSEKMIASGGDSVVEAYMAGVEIDSIFS